MRLIDADALPQGRVEWEDIVDAPTIDAVEVVRCKDCKWYISDGGTLMVCDMHSRLYFADTDYCSYGEKRK